MKAQIEMGTVVDALILLRHIKSASMMWEFATGDPHLPQGFNMRDVDRTIAGLENIKVTAKELCPQLGVQ